MNSSDKGGRAPNWRTVFGAPLVIGVASLAGLLAALLAGEFGRYFSWVALGSPVIVVAWLAVWRRSH